MEEQEQLAEEKQAMFAEDYNSNPNIDETNVETRTQSSAERHICRECGTSFVSLLKYMDHLNRHTGNKPYVCKECNKQFFTLSYLRNHQKLHSKDFQFICEVCGKPFKLKNNLQMHELTHTKEKPFKCDICDKGMINLSSKY